MEVTSVIIDIAGFKITETIHYKDNIPTRTEFHISTGTGNIVGRTLATWLKRAELGKL